MSFVEVGKESLGVGKESLLRWRGKLAVVSSKSRSENPNSP